MALTTGLLLAASAVACSTENGRGTLMGTLDVPLCTFNGGKTQPLPNGGAFKADWNSFLGEPFDSITPRFPANQLNIRMQSKSGGWEFADALFFWVLDSYEVARCLRGRMNEDGTPDWNTATCDRSPGALGPSGEGRSLIATERELVTAHLVLQNSCPSALISAAALGDCAGGSCPPVALCPGRGSWIAFSSFGSIPLDPGPPLIKDFRVNTGDTIEASAFHVELCDQTTVDDQVEGVVPVPPPAVRGTLDGSFSFKLQPNFR